MQIRFAAASDAEALTVLINQAFQVEKFFIDADRITLEEVRNRLAGGAFLVMEEDGTIRACVYVELRGERGYFGLLSVDPCRQRSGLGSQLVGAAEEYSRARGCRIMDLQVVNLRAELPPYYRSRGYRESGVAPFPPGVSTRLPCHFIRMSKRLERPGAPL